LIATILVIFQEKCIKTEKERKKRSYSNNAIRDENLTKNLSIQEIRFCEAVARGESAEEAHFKAYGSSITRTGWTNSGRIMARPQIQQRILEIQMGLEKDLRVDRERIAEEMADVAFANVVDYLDYDGESVTIRPLKELTKRQARAIKNVTAEKGRISLEFHDKIAAIRQLCAVLGIGQGDINLTQNNFVIRSPEVVKDSRAFEAMAQGFIEGEVLPPKR
jgi:phage terminase small subunit